MNNPYISIVVTTRNDNYGENMSQRLRMFVSSLNYYASKYPGIFELLIVEWNPPSNMTKLSDVIPLCDKLPIRIITVPPEIHETFNVKSPLLEFTAKNVGVRRSRGEFVLVTNPDIIFSSDLMYLLSTKSLEKNVLYRTDRFDFKGGDIDLGIPENFEKHAISKSFQGHLSDDNVHYIKPDTRLIEFPKSDYSILHTNGSGDFILSHKETYDKINGLYEKLEFKHHADSISVIRFFYNDVYQSILTAPACIFHFDHQRENRDAWDPYLAHKLGNSIGESSWGLKDYNLKEWSNIN